MYKHRLYNKKENNMDEKVLLINKIFSWRSLKYIFATIFLGAIGSGLWDLFLSELLYECASLSAHIFASIFSSYVEILHEDIGKGLNEKYSFFLVVLLFSMIIISVIFILIFLTASYRYLKNYLLGSATNKHVAKVDKQTRLKRFKKRIIIYFLLYMPLIIIYSTMIFDIVYEHKAIVFIERSLEIVAPYITNNELLLLRSKYRSISSAKEFYELEDELRSISAKKYINLPEFSSIRP